MKLIQAVLVGYALKADYKKRYRNQANQFIAWRDNVWDKCYEILNAFQNGEIEMPTVEYVLERLPSLEWEE